MQDQSRLLRVVFGLSTISVFAKIFGFAEKTVIAHFFGTTDMADVYFASTGIILSIIWIVKELMYPSLLPVFTESMSISNSVSGNLFRKAFFSAAAFLIVAAMVLIFLPSLLTKVLVPGFDESKRQVTVSLLRTLAPATIFLGLAMVTYTILNARRNFLKAACPEALLKLFIVLGLLALLPIAGIYALAIVTGLGGFGYLLAQLHFIPERRFLFKKDNNSNDAGLFKKVLLLMGPLVIGVLFSHISSLVDNLLASKLPGGHLSYLGYSKKLIDALLLIGPVALVTVVYSHLSHLASAKDFDKFRNLVARTFRLLLYLSIPVACLLVGLKQPIIRFLFQRGEFSATSTFGTSQAFMVYALGFTTFSLEILFVHSFFALKDTKTPVIYGVACVFLDIVLAILLLKPLGYLGIAGAFAISKTIKIIALGAVLDKKLCGLFDVKIIPFTLKIAATSCAVWLALKLLLGINNSDTFINTFAFDLMLPGIGALLTFVACSHLLRIDEFRAMMSLIRYKKAAVGTLYEEAK